MKKIRVAIIAGGRSSEHPISCISASGVLAAIDRSKFEPILFGITQSGTWIDMRQSDFERGSDGLSYVPEGGEKLIVDIHGIKDSKGIDLGIEIAFPLLHGA
jgi:D-alanine-D-alanine ligase